MTGAGFPGAGDAPAPVLVRGVAEAVCDTVCQAGFEFGEPVQASGGHARDAGQDRADDLHLRPGDMVRARLDSSGMSSLQAHQSQQACTASKLTAGECIKSRPCRLCAGNGAKSLAYRVWFSCPVGERRLRCSGRGSERWRGWGAAGW